MRKHVMLSAAAMLLVALAAPVAAMDQHGLAEAVEATEVERQSAMATLARQRADYPTYFQRAHERYPAIPRGVLEAIAYVETRWVHVEPDAHGKAGHHHMPASYGVMGLYRGGGFDNQVAEGAKLLGVSERLVLMDPETNILAAAALLDRALEKDGGTRRGDGGVEAMAGALARYAGYGSGDGNIHGFARQSFAYEVLQTLARGVDEKGIRIAAMPIEMELAFAADRLRLLGAPALRLDYGSDTISATDELVEERPARAAGRVEAQAFDVGIAMDFGEALWNPAHSSNYSTAGNGRSAVIMHTIEGSYAGGISWFKNPASNVSAHYVIRRSDGQVTQMVREHHQAWHAAYHNHYTIGIEHDGRAGDAGNWTSAMINASARLTRSICARQPVNCASAWQGPGYDYWRVVPDSVRIKGHGMLTSNQNRYDPGRYFPWASFYNLINNGAPPPATAPTYWVDTYASAPGFPSPTGGSQSGSLHAGTNYVYCKAWGREIRSGATFNRWWLKTDLDVGPAGQYVSAYYLSRWGNDEARDNDGYDLPRCDVLPHGEIGRKYYAMGGVRSHLGVPEFAEAAAQAGGRYQQFKNGMILWHSRTGAFAVNGKILEHYRATGSETRWGFAMTDELDAAVSPVSGQRGKFQYFEDGLFLWTPATGAHAVHGAILAHFENNGREAALGYPKTDEQAHGSNGRKQQFERKTLYWTPERGVWAE
ncbi:N-acetylmuramoyl-L-alanine amidase [Luteimonas changyuni]|uniref:N-acetylmuramoyl-L-alanine amidase n=1 Tax=Luteimonas sp. MJ145 TaxID=3129234 RepID=UPI0031BA8CD9